MKPKNKMKSKFLVVAAFVLTFAAGVLTGAIVVREYSRPLPPWGRMEHEPRQHPPMRSEALKSQLHLSEAQSQKVAEIIAGHEERLRKHLGQMRPLSHQILKEMTMQIDSVLTPEQRMKFREAFPLPPPFRKMPPRPWPTLKDSSHVRF
jgi:Spy/CpxP family protein refolding chaperone